jgi:hypothetical protein
LSLGIVTKQVYWDVADWQIDKKTGNNFFECIKIIYVFKTSGKIE